MLSPWGDKNYKPKQCIKKAETSLCWKSPYSQSCGFPAVMCELDHKECWAPKNGYFQIVVLEKILDSSWTGRRSNQSILKGIKLEYLSEGPMLKLQYFGHLMRRADSFGKNLMLRKIVGRKRKGKQRMRWLVTSLTQWTWVWTNPWRWWRTRKPDLLQSMGSQRVRHDWVSRQLQVTRSHIGKLGFLRATMETQCCQRNTCLKILHNKILFGRHRLSKYLFRWEGITITQFDTWAILNK